MANRGTRQRGNLPHYDPASGHSYRPTPSIPPAEATKLITAAEHLGVSVSEYLVQLVRRDKHDWWPDYNAERHGTDPQLELGLTA